MSAVGSHSLLSNGCCGPLGMIQQKHEAHLILLLMFRMHVLYPTCSEHGAYAQGKLQNLLEVQEWQPPFVWWHHTRFPWADLCKDTKGEAEAHARSVGKTFTTVRC